MNCTVTFPEAATGVDGILSGLLTELGPGIASSKYWTKHSINLQ
jgi:hypothetical protein